MKQQKYRHFYTQIFIIIYVLEIIILVKIFVTDFKNETKKVPKGTE